MIVSMVSPLQATGAMASPLVRLTAARRAQVTNTKEQKEMRCLIIYFWRACHNNWIKLQIFSRVYIFIRFVHYKIKRLWRTEKKITISIWFELFCISSYLRRLLFWGRREGGEWLISSFFKKKSFNPFNYLGNIFSAVMVGWCSMRTEAWTCLPKDEFDVGTITFGVASVECCVSGDFYQVGE